MSEEKKTRTVDDVRNEYTQLCVRAGHLQYSIKTTQEDLDVLNKQLRELNFEAAGLAAAEKKEEKPNA